MKDKYKDIMFYGATGRKETPVKTSDFVIYNKMHKPDGEIDDRAIIVMTNRYPHFDYLTIYHDQWAKHVCTWFNGQDMSERDFLWHMMPELTYYSTREGDISYANSKYVKTEEERQEILAGDSYGEHEGKRVIFNYTGHDEEELPPRIQDFYDPGFDAKGFIECGSCCGSEIYDRAGVIQLEYNRKYNELFRFVHRTGDIRINNFEYADSQLSRINQPRNDIVAERGTWGG